MSTVKDMSRKIAEAVYAALPEIEAEAGQRGQNAQDSDAEMEHLLVAASEVVESILKRVVFQAAEICERRAIPEDKGMSLRNEASKCADSIRHFLLCDDGENVCMWCDGTGVVNGRAGGVCFHCNGKGIR